MQSVPSFHGHSAVLSQPSNYIEGGFIDLSAFLQTFIKDLATQLETCTNIEEVHAWANSSLPQFISQADKRTSALRDTVLTALQSSNSGSSPPGLHVNVLPCVGGMMAQTPTGMPSMMMFDPTSPRSQRVHSIDTLAGEQHSSRTNSMVRFQGGRGEGGAAAGGGGAELPPSVSPSGMSRPGSFSNRMGSFTRKHYNGIEVPMLKDDASGVVVDALNDTYSLASRGSYRRRAGGPGGSLFSQQHGASSVHASHAINGMKRRAYLSFVQLEGMPNLDIDAEELRTRFSRPSKRHTNVFRDNADLESLVDECNLPRIHDINSLEFNIFEEFQKFGDNAFTIVAMNILLKYTFVTTFHFKIPALLTFVKTLQSFYRNENPFHNALHGADVLQTTHLYLCQRDVKENFSDVELFALLFAAMAIDVGHLGVNNHFLIKTHHPLATLYSGTSPMEAMSSALAFCILDDPDCNFIQDSVVWDREVETEFRALVTDLILRSDDCEHAVLSQDIDTILARGVIGDDAVPQLLCAVLHAADTSYMCKPRHIYLEWAFRFMAENYRQGDAEEDYARMYRDAHPDVKVDAETQWLRISKFCDRSTMPATELQQSVMEHIVLPFVTLLQPFLPTQWAERLEANFRYLQENQEEKTIVLQNGVQEQLWRKGVAPTWFDVPPTSGKNFLHVIRNWIAAEMPDGAVGGAMQDGHIQQPSKIAAESSSLPVVSGRGSESSRPSNVSDLDEITSSTLSKGNIQSHDMLKVSKDGKKRLSVSQIPPPGAATPSLASGLNAVHILTGEMLKHMHTLLHAGSPGSWDPSRETAIFAQEWVKLLRTLEAQDSGPALLSTLAANNQLRALNTSAHTSEESESIGMVEVLRDQTSPFAHFRRGKASALATASASSELVRRESVNDMLLSNAPFASAVLLTQMWWIVFGIVEENVHLGGNQEHILTPDESNLVNRGAVDSDEELSVSQKGEAPSPMGADQPQTFSTAHPPPPRSPKRVSSESHRRSSRKNSNSTQPPAPQQGGGGGAQHQDVVEPAAPPVAAVDTKPVEEPFSAIEPPATGVTSPTKPSAPAPPSAIREIMSSTRRMSAAVAGADPPRRGSSTPQDSGRRGSELDLSGQQSVEPSPVRYVLQKRNSLR